MGYDIIFVPVHIVSQYYPSVYDYDDGVGAYDKLRHEAIIKSYLSYNFSNISLTGQDFKDYLYLPNVAGHKTSVLKNIFGEVYEKLLEEGWIAEIPKGTWKAIENNKEIEYEIDDYTRDMNVFTYHIKNLQELCDMCEDECGEECVMIIDYTHTLHLDDDEIKSFHDDKIKKEEQRIKDKKKMFKPVEYLHPRKGKIYVKDYKTCTEIYVLEFQRNGDYKKWKDLCQEMPDAPVFTKTKYFMPIKSPHDIVEVSEKPDIPIYEYSELEDEEDE